MRVQNVTITRVKHKGSNQVAFNVDLDGRPFGQIWTFKANGEWHPYHVSTLSGFYGEATTYDDAEKLIRGQM
jgi:hypothetical protein